MDKRMNGWTGGHTYLFFLTVLYECLHTITHLVLSSPLGNHFALFDKVTPFYDCVTLQNTYLIYTEQVSALYTCLGSVGGDESSSHGPCPSGLTIS